MNKKKVQHVLKPETIVKLKVLAAKAGKNQSEFLTSLIDEKWECQECTKSSIPQNRAGGS